MKNTLQNAPTKTLRQQPTRRKRYYSDFDDDFNQDYDSGLSYSQQVWADRADYAREMYEAGHIDETQRMEIEMGA